MDQLGFAERGRSRMTEASLWVSRLRTFCPVRQRQAPFTPEALDLLVIDPPALHAQELTDFAVPVPSILLGEPDQSKTQIIVILLL